MIILHIANLTDDYCGGVNVAVPQHVKVHQDVESVALINITNKKILGINNQIDFENPFVLKNIPKSFRRPDLVVFHEVYRPQYLRLYKILQKEKIPYIIVPHGCLTQQAQKKKWFKKVIANHLLFNEFINNAIGLQFLSNNEMEQSHFKNNKFVGTNGISLLNKKCCHANLNKNSINITYIGSLFVQIKGLDLMLKAVAIQADKFRDNNIKLCLYGPDEENSHNQVKKLVMKNKIEDIVNICGAVWGEEKEKILLNTDIFIQTSRSEGMSMGLLEALSYGIPCLVSRGTNIDKKIKEYDAGWTSEVNSISIAEAISESIQDVLEEKNWTKKSENAVKLVKEEFSWEIICQETLDIYRRLTGMIGV